MLRRRPGKNEGSHSATFDGHVFYVFSSNAAPFESEHGYSIFQVYTLLEHCGDFTRAAAALLAKGYGTPDSATFGVDFSAFNRRLAEGPVAPPAQSSEPKPVSYSDLVRDYPVMRPVLIDGLLRLGETMNVIAPPKTGKSWLVTDLALSIAMGTDWFGYQCERGKIGNAGKMMLNKAVRLAIERIPGGYTSESSLYSFCKDHLGCL